jgi:hypothetical protein
MMTWNKLKEITMNEANQHAVLPTKTIYCYRSGTPLANITALCSQGWPLLNSFQAKLLHPIYEMPLAKLIVKLKDHLAVAEQAEWTIKDYEILEIRLCMSAIMYSLDAIWQAPAESRQHIPSLPSMTVAVGSASRLVHLAGWYHFITSKRLSFPLYRIAAYNKNTNWENFNAWLDDAETVRKEWESGRDKLAHAEELRRRDAALLTVKAENIYKRIDFNKVWNWIDIQISTEYAAGRRETFKQLFMKGDINPEDWIADDVDDLVEAILVCCDTGNEITHFIHTRLNHIRAIIADFYGSFTLLDTVVKDNNAHPDLIQTPAEREFFGEIDRKVDSLSELPPAPKRESFASMAHFLKAQAQYNLLARRWNARKGV